MLSAVSSGAGTLQVPRVLAVVQVPCRCPGSCQQWCRYRAGALAAVSNGAGTLQVPRVSVVVQSLPTESYAQRFPWCVIRRLSVCARKPPR